MKGILLALLLQICVSGMCQERVNYKQPLFSKSPIGTLAKASGWKRYANGIWHSKQNTIPVDLDENERNLQNYENYNLGDDYENFLSIELRKVIINNEPYYAILKYFKDGFFEYESINEGWHNRTSALYYVFNINDMSKFMNMKTDSINILNIDAKYIGEVRFITPNASFLKQVTDDLSEQVLSGERTIEFYENKTFNFIIKKHKDKIRFIINPGSTEFKDMHQWDESIDDRYYEVDRNLFNAFIKTNL